MQLIFNRSTVTKPAGRIPPSTGPCLSPAQLPHAQKCIRAVTSPAATAAATLRRRRCINSTKQLGQRPGLPLWVAVQAAAAGSVHQTLHPESRSRSWQEIPSRSNATSTQQGSKDKNPLELSRILAARSRNGKAPLQAPPSTALA
ncbi:hypothetical protein VOLCADRAFT_106642 [Volvox carteri f. nagariensis]|uniref:Uncharacterized protein n=1 Tax=Volvox carteri f. nagariensis TaxID=3068 RepID=D8U8U9_VOLCA|nr:uncharacterized protein VOLCADRAFT_106642 [Volvox carteri f. nagariensis]EFJ43812.1 hypothetical protein VOLCADRAFT_106642 [Volvox carteri f. nagariensis]|eukprot:XP_002955058.1 hypothetical protein VOLCADRAFT_106642 [Volvox carteri f. nagariensis]